MGLLFFLSGADFTVTVAFSGLQLLCVYIRAVVFQDSYCSMALFSLQNSLISSAHARKMIGRQKPANANVKPCDYSLRESGSFLAENTPAGGGGGVEISKLQYKQ